MTNFRKCTVQQCVTHDCASLTMHTVLVFTFQHLLYFWCSFYPWISLKVWDFWLSHTYYIFIFCTSSCVSAFVMYFSLYFCLFLYPVNHSKFSLSYMLYLILGCTASHLPLKTRSLKNKSTKYLWPQKITGFPFGEDVAETKYNIAQEYVDIVV